MLAGIITIIVKIIIFQAMRINWFGGFYRKRPAAVNFMFIINEAWSLAFAWITMLMRSFLLLVVSIFYVGRIDTPFLAPGVGWIINKFPPDRLPIAFRKDLVRFCSLNPWPSNLVSTSHTQFS